MTGRHLSVAVLVVAVGVVAAGCVTISQRPPPMSPILVPTPSAPSSQPSAVPIASPTTEPTNTPQPSPTPSSFPTPESTQSTTPVETPVATPDLPDTRACRDDAYTLSGYRWDRPLEWHFAADSVPARYDAERVLELVSRSFDNITGAYNDCGLPDRVAATAIYRGTATGAVCGESDDVNLVGFGRLRGNFLAVTCPWTFSDDTYAEIDIEIDRNTDWALGEDCDDEFFLEAVITHEVGHAFGLGHVGERRHADLTMSTTGPVCDNEEATLGLGDVLGLEELYGP